MRLLGTFFFSLSVFALLFGQATEKASVEWGNEFSTKQDGLLEYYIDTHEDDALVVFQIKRTRKIVRLSAAHEQIATREIDFKINNVVFRDEQFHLLGDRLLQFGSVYLKKEKVKKLYLKAYDAKTLKVLQDWTEIADIDSGKRTNQGGFEVHTSPNREKVLIQYFLPYEKGAPESFALQVLNPDFSLDWEGNYTLEYADEDFSYEDFVIDDHGNLLILAQVNVHTERESRKLEKAERSPYSYHLLVIDRGSAAISHDYELKLGEKFLQEMFLTIPRSGDFIYCNGFYSENGTYSIRGSYFMSLDKETKEVVASDFHEYEDEFITMYMNEKQETKQTKRADRKGDEVEMADLLVRETITHNDGSMTTVSEQYDYWETSYLVNQPNGGVQRVTTKHYLFRDILMHRVDPDGKLIWKSRIPKHQYTLNDNGKFSGYSSTLKNNNFHLIFNDHEDNLGFKKGDILKQMRVSQKKSIISLVSLDLESGNFERELLVDVERGDLICIPQKSYSLKDQLVLFAERGKWNKFGTVSFKD